MPALTLRPSSSITVLVAVLLSTFTSGCGWRRTMIFPSPSKKAAIEVWQRPIANEWGAQVELVTARRRSVLDKITREAFIYFVHVYWSADETKVGVLATGFNFCRVAYDIRNDKLLPFDQIRAELGRSISRMYRVPSGEDPVEWAATADAQAEFFKLHPEIRLSYR
jgi:hypothetical protein